MLKRFNIFSICILSAVVNSGRRPGSGAAPPSQGHAGGSSGGRAGEGGSAFGANFGWRRRQQAPCTAVSVDGPLTEQTTGAAQLALPALPHAHPVDALVPPGSPAPRALSCEPPQQACSALFDAAPVVPASIRIFF